MDIKANPTVARHRARYRQIRGQVMDLIERIPILGRFLSEFLRVEFIDRCMLIAAQGLLALIPMLVVISAFAPHAIEAVMESFRDATGIDQAGAAVITNEVTPQDVRAQTGFIGLAITFFSAASFSRAIQRTFERVWDLPHIGGVSGYRRCLVWLIGWMLTLQLVGALRALIDGFAGIVGESLAMGLQMVAFSLIWWATAWLLLFGRVSWRDLALGAALTGIIGVLYSRASSLVMPPYVEANAQQFGTLGVILAISTWLIGYAGILVASAMVGRVVIEDPTVKRIVSATWRASRFGSAEAGEIIDSLRWWRR